MDLETRINRGKEAGRLLGEPVLVEAFEKLRAAYISEFTESAIPDSARRETAFLMLTALGDLQRQIKAFVTDGSMAESSLKKRSL